ncbi:MULTISPECIES: metal ABC transporter permease [Micromonospora]|uniref:Metal ABC transporter permease n=1 Tax=Micromonospora chalcea TaxID=1874 RepID=A0ABX9XYM4_MICCH|nr:MULTISPECIES: metal ABC transporter permease [Micromonospora]EWM68156.1 ABC transporter permease [Micromonospora sp. M42]MBC8993782.1 metal ABC transporter permease [Micromonospora chalcea]MBP1785029.1 zinc transport system permease protein [Micromonospora sp. HB375]MBQ1064020.1 metal ABC transporter permease [Micromonospora sp. C41]MBQ1069496.1 metal ABC transporter permease [Micromonospora sp. D75]
MDLFQYDFMLRALVGALIIGLAAPALGIYLVQRRLALIGDGIGHVALTGVGAGLLLNRSPVLVAVIAATLGAIVIELVRAYGRTSGDLALALLFYGGIAGGVVLVGLSDASSGALNAYLFGSLTTTSQGDLVTIGVLGAALLVTMLVLRPALFAVCHDEEYARVSGLPVRALNLIIAVGTAITVTIAMRAVGVLLISALMVVPVATAQQVTRGFRSTMAAAMALGLFAAGAGVWVAATADTAPGASVVLVAIGSFLLVALGAAGVRALRRRSGSDRAAPPVEPAEHEVLLG